MLLAPLLLSGCSLLGLGGNHMRATGDAPFSLGKVASALWIEDAWADPAEGDGEGFLVLTTADIDCEDLAAELNGEVQPKDSFIVTERGIAVDVEWWDPRNRNAGFEGAYYSGLYPLGYDEGPDAETFRYFQLSAFSDGATWSDDYSIGKAEITDYGDEVVGTLRSQWVKASFEAENCGKLESTYEYWDYWDYWDYWEY